MWLFVMSMTADQSQMRLIPLLLFLYLLAYLDKTNIGELSDDNGMQLQHF